MLNRTIIYRLSALAVILLAGVACVKLSTYSDAEKVPVGFSVYSPTVPGSKADPAFYVPSTRIPAGGEIAVYAWYHDNSGWEADKTTLNPNFMYRQYVKNDTSNPDAPNFVYSPVKYWPNESSDSLSFWALYPFHKVGDADPALPAGLVLYASGGSTPYGPDSAGLPVVEYTASYVPKEQIDLLFSEMKADQSKPAVGGKVDLRFRHVMSKILFNVTNSSEDLPVGASVLVKSLTVTNIYTKATCSNPSASIASAAQAEAFWSAASVAHDIIINPAVDPDVELGTSEAVLLVMPQSILSTAQLTLTYDIGFVAADDPDDFITYSTNIVSTIPLWRDSDGVHSAYGVKKWLAGRQYQYNIEAGLEKIEFSEVVSTNWIWNPADEVLIN